MNTPTLTVFTPTYNRDRTLPRLYRSLCDQTNNDFSWLIIDDGSTDNTRKLVERWIDEDIIPITYIYQPNGGMHVAHNTALEHCVTELNTCIDSDDYLTSDAVEKILRCWREHGGRQYSGIIALDGLDADTVLGSRLPEGMRSARRIDLVQYHGMKGDKKLIFRTELRKLYPYPVFAGENYGPPSSKYIQLDKDYDMLLLNEIVCIVEYLPDGNSRNKLKQFRRFPKGFAYARNILMSSPVIIRKLRYRHAMHYVSASFFARDLHFLHKSSAKLLTVCAIIPGILLHLLIRWKTRSHA